MTCFWEFVSCPEIIATLAIGSLLTWIWCHRKRYSGCPPGPRGLPLVGYLPFVSKNLHLVYNELAKKYGDVFSVVLGWRYIIVLNNLEVMKEAFVKDGDIYAGKPHDGIEAYFGERKSVFMTDGLEWREQRRFIVSTLRDFGFGKNKLEEFTKNEAQILCQNMLEKRDKPIPLRKMMTHASANVMSSLIYDKTYSYDDTSLTELLIIFEIDPSFFSQLSPIDLYPILEYLPGRFTGFKELDKVKNAFYDHVDKLVQEHERTYDETNIRDLIDSYLMKFKQLEKNPELRDLPENVVYTREYMRASVVVLFSAGVDTTATSTAWTLKLLAAHPKAQERVQAEIDDVIGTERPPTTSDRSKMPYTEAVLLEAFRYISLVTFTFWHRITDDTTLRGYRIPKNAFVVANMWNIHHNQETWGDPENFRPERFLDQDGKKIDQKLREHVIPFSIGKRNCLGESLARMEIFIYITSCLQKMSFHPPKGKPFTFEPDIRVPVAYMKNYDVCVEPRV